MDANGRTPHGVRGLKCVGRQPGGQDIGRTPHGVRGLKFQYAVEAVRLYGSHPARGAWIEISFVVNVSAIFMVAPRTGCVD